MAQLAYQNFDGLTAGAAASAAGFTNVSPAAFLVSSLFAVSPANGFGETTNVDGHIVIYTSVSAPADQATQIATAAIGTGTAQRASLGLLLRCSDSSATNAYLIDFDPFFGSMIIYKKTGAGFTSLTSATTGTFTSGQTYNLKAEASGTTIRGRVWSTSGSEPGTWNVSTTDASYATGNVGVRTELNGTYSAVVVALDDFYMGDAGTTFAPGAPSATAFTLTGPSAGPANAASTNFTVTPTGGVTSGTFTPTVISGVSYTPTTLTWSADASARTFKVTKAAPGTVSINGTFSSGETPPSSVSYTAKATTTRGYTVQGGTPSVTTYYTIKNVDGTAFGARTSTGVTDQGGGVYSVTAAVAPLDYAGTVVWDQGSGAYAADGLSPPAGLKRFNFGGGF